MKSIKKNPWLLLVPLIVVLSPLLVSLLMPIVVLLVAIVCLISLHTAIFGDSQQVINR